MLDIATVNSGGNNITILLNEGNGTFAPGGNYPAGNSPRSLAAADFNDDGHLDLAVASFNNHAVVLLLNDGDGAFTAGVSLVKTNSRPHGIVAADFTGNGLADIAVANNNLHSVTLYPGNRDGSFGEGVDFAAVSNPVHLAAVDLDGDGYLDLVALPNSGTTVGVLWGQIGGGFSDMVSVPVGGNTTGYSLRLQDIDGDGLVDLLIARGNTVAIRYNLGARQFEAAASHGMGTTVRSGLSGDFNEDGIPDLVAVASGSNILQIRFGRQETRLAVDTTTGFRHGRGRGVISGDTAAHYDYWSFSARAGERLLLAYENFPNPTATSVGLRFRLLRPDGPELALLNPWRGQDQLGTVLPVSGQYVIEVCHHYNYTGEYRLRVTLAPPPWQWESESNDTVANANAPTLQRDESLQRFQVLGYLRTVDIADIFALRNHPVNSPAVFNELPDGTTVEVGLLRSADSTLVPLLDILNTSGSPVAIAEPGAASLAYTVPDGGEGRFYVRVRETASNDGLLADYGLTATIHVPVDDVPPAILSVSLPAEGVTSTSLIDRFGFTFSEDLDIVSANFLSNYALRGAGPDGILGTDDDEIYPLSLANAYGTGLSIHLLIGQGPLQPDHYRFTISTNLKDIAGNPLAEPYVREFTVASIDGFVLEDRGGNTPETATSLSTLPPGRFDGSFATGPSFATGSDPYAVRAVDLNGNGILDLVVAQYTANNIGVLLSRGDGSFEDRVDYPVGARPRHLAIADFNGDGHLDIASANETGNSVSVLLNNGNGTFVSSGLSGAGSSPRALAAGDFNGNGNIDLAVASYNSNAVILLLGNGDGTFTAGTQLDKSGSRPHGIAAADFNGDGKLDIAVANNSPNSATVYLGNGDGIFGAGTDYVVLAEPVALAAADLTGNGIIDLVAIPNSHASVSFLRGNGDGTFSDSASLAFGANTANRGLLLEDIDGDGRPEILVARGNAAAVRFNLGSGAFDPAANFPTASTARDIAAGDFDGDGIPDLAVASSGTNAIQILHGRRARLLVEEPPGSGFRTVAGRGVISGGSTDHYDYWSFTARAGDRLLLAYQNRTNPTGYSTGLRFRVIRPDGSEIASMSPWLGQEQLAVTLPVTGAYWIEVRHNYNYTGEYRFRVTLV